MANMINPEAMHLKAQEENDMLPTYDVSFRDYVLMRLRNFSGNNYIPRVVCTVLTKEYIIIAARPKCLNDEDELPAVADELSKAGYYVEVDDEHIAKISNTVSMLICWDPTVKAAMQAKETLDNPHTFQLYVTAMQYIRAEQALSTLPMNIKDELLIGDVRTNKWVSLAVLTAEMYAEALLIGDFLWKKGYFVGIRENERRPGTWIMFICWDQYVVSTMGQHSAEFTFSGKPGSWN